MAKPTRVTMYSVDEQGRVVEHHFPWEKDSPKYEPLRKRGFTFDRPMVDNLKDNDDTLVSPRKKAWRDMNAPERKAFKEARQNEI